MKNYLILTSTFVLFYNASSLAQASSNMTDSSGCATDTIPITRAFTATPSKQNTNLICSDHPYTIAIEPTTCLSGCNNVKYKIRNYASYFHITYSSKDNTTQPFSIQYCCAKPS